MDYAQLAQVRFGFGPAPGRPGPADSAAILAALAGPDRLAERWPGLSTSEAMALSEMFLKLKRAASGKDDVPDPEAAMTAFDVFKRQFYVTPVRTLQIALARAVEDGTGFRERLWAFWRDHFTVRMKAPQHLPLVAAYQEALRPHITGRFASLLRRAETHPMMLLYLDQNASVGPNSVRAQRQPGRGLGLNENLAREAMELHTLGVNGHYTQADVRQLAELLTGLHVGKAGMDFAPGRAEPGAEMVLGQGYGGNPAKLEDVYAVLDALAAHPDTARHLSTKLAVHFVGPAPDPALIEAMTSAYQHGDGDLMAVYQVLLSHPAALRPQFEKIRQPFDYLATGMRALGLDGAAVMALPDKAMRRGAYRPMRAMGQNWNGPPAPNGWPEQAEEWISPQQLAARVSWALVAPRLFGAPVADPVVFAHQALGARLGPALQQAVPRAESRPEGAALVLASAEFMRR